MTVIGQNEGVTTHDCAITVKENGRVSILYSNGWFRSQAGQIAYASSLYTNGDDWHTRTILEGVNVTNLELDTTLNILNGASLEMMTGITPS